jgi:phosphatidylinositol glycan class T
MGSGNERGAIAILLKSTDELNDSPLGAKSASDGCELNVNIFQVVPWYIRVYCHSLQLFVDDINQRQWELLWKRCMFFLPKTRYHLL